MISNLSSGQLQRTTGWSLYPEHTMKLPRMIYSWTISRHGPITPLVGLYPACPRQLICRSERKQKRRHHFNAGHLKNNWNRSIQDTYVIVPRHLTTHAFVRRMQESLLRVCNNMTLSTLNRMAFIAAISAPVQVAFCVRVWIRVSRNPPMGFYLKTALMLGAITFLGVISLVILVKILMQVGTIKSRLRNNSAIVSEQWIKGWFCCWIAWAASIIVPI